ncbi:uncharacterized protein LOC126736813 [Anthonomus grandis grandis]|uniref:uncharacterized protein LOC126736813 n=1 Tax=Anthonomus grandis grandis TaxID=2921223 RepID=UPI0021662E76|nr:uncharacterized protein LOC126736813 [Anthonomus grandis grandis]XP_050297322.1 uncharacterized protein LOC126736813 [Anthonomus grandis grandis]
MADPDLETFLERMNSGISSKQLIAIEKLCISLLTVNKEQCFESYPPGICIPALCRIFLDKQTSEHILEVVASAISYYVNLSDECIKEIMTINGAIKAICNRLVNEELVGTTSKNLAGQCVKFLELICIKDAEVVLNAGGLSFILLFMRDQGNLVQKDTLISVMAIISHLCTKMEQTDVQLLDCVKVLSPLLEHEDYHVADEALRCFVLIEEKFTKTDVRSIQLNKYGEELLHWALNLEWNWKNMLNDTEHKDDTKERTDLRRFINILIVMTAEECQHFLQFITSYRSSLPGDLRNLDSLLCIVRKVDADRSHFNPDSINTDTNTSRRGFINDTSTQQVSSSHSSQNTNQQFYKSKVKSSIENKKIHIARTKFEKLFNQIPEAISEGNVDTLKKFNYYISNTEKEVTYTNLTNSDVNITNLLILACKHNRVNTLEYLFDSNLVETLSDITGMAVLPDDHDETCHNAFYYAIRSNNLKLLDTLIDKWPGNYFANHLNELDEILSGAYDELKIKNVSLIEDMEIFVQDKLINLRFFSDASTEGQNVTKSSLNNIKDRIELVLQNINSLKTKHLKSIEKFLFIVKFIAQNIHILKRQLKSTYDRIPWEEMEFCLIGFVSSYKKQQEINLFYNATLNKNRIISHLENFAILLQKAKDRIDASSNDKIQVRKLAELPKLKRDKVVAYIISTYPQLEELYKDYQQIRDIHSLEKIRDYIKLALLINPKQSEDQLIFTRVLQMIGEYLKNTLESPKLSSTISELLLLSLPRNTRQVIIDLRNALSHAYSLSSRIQFEKNTDDKFFTGIQNDIEKIDSAITEILYNNKIKIIITLLKKISNSQNLEDVKELSRIFSSINYYSLDKSLESFKIEDHNKIKLLIEKLNNVIKDKTNYEKELFNKINYIISVNETKSANIESDFVATVLHLGAFGNTLNDIAINPNIIRGIQFGASKQLEIITAQIEYPNLKDIIELIIKISDSAISRIHDNSIDELYRLRSQIFRIAELKTGDLKWVVELRDKLKVKRSFIPKEKPAYKITGNLYGTHLKLKLSKLENILRNYVSSDDLIKNYSNYKTNKKLQALVEMLVLDIMSLLERSEMHLENNILFLDENSPLLTGKCLRNHLAHDNFFVEILLSDPSIAILLNAKKLISKNIIESNKKIGKFIMDDPSKLNAKYNQSLVYINNQEKMFAALEEGINFEDLMNYFRKGTDINARSINLSTALHFAARGGNIEVIKFIIDQKISANAKDVNSRSPLHIAAAYGRENIIDFFLGETDLYVDDLDCNNKTPLHIAAENGQKEAVEILLKYNANTNTTDLAGFAPVHLAVKNNHIDVVKILLKKESDVDINEVMGGFTSLHLAAENGHLEIVNFLLKNGANVNAKTDRGGTPLHLAALNGHLEVVKALIFRSANINSRVLDGCTPLHYAIETGREEIANILLEYGADVSVADKTYNNTPLHYAAKDGHENIVNALLKNKANARVATVAGITPLHFAVQGNHLKIVATLLEHGANIHARDINHATPLLHAVESGHKAVAELLIKYGAEINDKNILNNTPLHVAASWGHKDVIELLIQHNANVKAEDIKGYTPLHAAARKGNKDIIDLLIQNKADVNARTTLGITPLVLAAGNGCKDAVAILLKSKAEINGGVSYGFTTLEAAILGGNKDIVAFLIQNNADINEENIVTKSTPLHLAVETGNKEIVEILVQNGADVNSKAKNPTPLLSAIKQNNKEIVQILIENGADVSAGDIFEPLSLAIFAGCRDIVNVLLKQNVDINMKGLQNTTPLHWAAKEGYKNIVIDLISRGAIIDAVALDNITPLYLAASEGHEEVAKILIANKADVNFGNPLHIAAGQGHVNVVEVLLINGADINSKDIKNRRSIELAVAHGHLPVVELLMQYGKIDINAKSNDDSTMLHIASQNNDLRMVKYLVDQGSDINAKNAFGSKPIHIAARDGFKATVKFFLSRGLSINELGAAKQTLLHYATINGHLKVVKYLVAQGADVNAKDIKGLTPIHVAANFGHKNIIEILLKSGGIYNSVDKLYRRALDMTNNKDVISLLASTEKLFNFVKHNSPLEVENIIKAGAFINAKNSDNVTPLHYAAWKGYDKIAEVLLKYNANPNAIGSKGSTPVHYAAKFSHLVIVKALLGHGAIYDAVSDSGNTPLGFSTDRDIISLLKLVDASFKKVKEGNGQVINDLNKIKNIDTVKAVMKARNKDNETLVVVAIQNNFSKVKQLKEIWQSGIAAQIFTALELLNQGNYAKALSILELAFERRKEILGPDNPGTLDIQTNIAKVLYKQGNYQEALNILEQILQKQKEILGLNNKDALYTRSMIALVLHRQGKNKEAFENYQKIFEKQREILGPDHSDTLVTQFHMALVLDALENYEEALKINQTVFEKRKESLGIYNPTTLSAQNNIAMVLANQKKYQESLKMYKEVYEKKKIILGAGHADTLRTLHNMAGILLKQKKYSEAFTAFQEVLSFQKEALQPYHPDTLNTQYNIGNLLFAQGKYIKALKFYKECLELRKVVFGPNHPSVLDILIKVNAISLKVKHEGSNISEILQHLQTDINTAASEGDIKTIQHLLKDDGLNVNDTDIDGRTTLHFAVSNGHINIVKILLNHGANVCQATNKGNTALHIATSKHYKEIVEVLLQHMSRDKLHDFVNAKTTSSGVTSLHVAAKSGFLDFVELLLRHGAIYNIKNKEGKMPIDLCTDQRVIKLLKLIEEMFEGVKTGNAEVINKLGSVNSKKFLALTNARNNQGNTLLQVAIAKKHKHISGNLIKMLKVND